MNQLFALERINSRNECLIRKMLGFGHIEKCCVVYEGRLYGFGELAFGGVGVVILRMPSPSQMYLPVTNLLFINRVKLFTLWIGRRSTESG